MMIHPYLFLQFKQANCLIHQIYPFDSAAPRILALQELSVEFSGKEAHASVSPWEGVNALVCIIFISVLYYIDVS